MPEQQKQPPRIAAAETGPGPLRYKLPPTLGSREHDVTKYKAPAYSIGTPRKFTADDNPGPGYFVDPGITRFGQSSTSRIILTGRPIAKAPEIFPAPGQYNADAVDIRRIQEKNNPPISLKFRTRNPSVDRVPAPNTYNPPTVLGTKVIHKKSSPGYSFSPRIPYASANYDFAKTPGPVYSSTDPTSFKRKHPAYSMRPRVKNPPTMKTDVPGPGAYYSDSLPITSSVKPGFTMGTRHSQYVMPILTAVDID